MKRGAGRKKKNARPVHGRFSLHSCFSPSPPTLPAPPPRSPNHALPAGSPRHLGPADRPPGRPHGHGRAGGAQGKREWRRERAKKRQGRGRGSEGPRGLRSLPPRPARPARTRPRIPRPRPRGADLVIARVLATRNRHSAAPARRARRARRGAGAAAPLLSLLASALRSLAAGGAPAESVAFGAAWRGQDSLGSPPPPTAGPPMSSSACLGRSQPVLSPARRAEGATSERPIERRPPDPHGIGPHPLHLLRRLTPAPSCVSHLPRTTHTLADSPALLSLLYRTSPSPRPARPPPP